MNPSDLKTAIERRHGGVASLVQTVPVRAHLMGTVRWQGVVYIFALANNRKARRAYAWPASPVAAPDGRIFTALHIGPIDSPTGAVCAALADAVREDRYAELQRARQAG